MGGKASYDFDAKNRWRGWWVNQFARRLGGNRTCLRGKRVLYLPADDGGEAELLIERGFSRENLYAIDVDPANAARSRQRGVKSIAGDFHTAVKAWPVDVPLHAVAADLCCSFGASAVDLDVALMSSPATQSGMVVGVNLSRGRDAWSNEARRSFVGAMDDEPLVRVFLSSLTGVGYRDVPLNRALAWWVNKWAPFTPTGQAQLEEFVSGATDRHGTHWRELAPVLLNVQERAIPSFYSYRSGNLVMDSIVFTWPLEMTGIDRSDVGAWCDMRSKRTVHGKKLKVTRPKIAAMRAVLRKQMEEV